MIGLFLIVPFILAQGTQNEAIPESRINSENFVSESIAYLNYVEGDVFFQGQNHEAIMQGEGLRSERGKAEVYLGSGNWLRLNQYTRVVFTGLRAGFIQIYVEYGQIYIRAENTIEIQTPHKNFSLYGLYRIEVSGNKTKKFHNPMYEDSFDKWNYWREKEANHPNEYLPENYTSSLYNYGSWRWNSAYGWAWIPLRSYWGLRYSYWPWTFSYGIWYQDATWGWYWIPKRTYFRGNTRTVISKNQLRNRRNASNRTVSKAGLRKRTPQNISESRIKRSSAISTRSPTRITTRKVYSPRKSVSSRSTGRKSFPRSTIKRQVRRSTTKKRVTRKK